MMPNTQQKDQYHGCGGSYTVNPDTQQRELVERTQTQAETDAAQEKTAEARAARKMKEK